MRSSKNSLPAGRLPLIDGVIIFARDFCLWRWIFKIAVDPLAPLTARGEEGAERENAWASPGWNRWRLTKQQV